MKEEKWKDIPGYEGRYQASNLGRIKSLKRKVTSRNWYTGKEFLRTVPECILRLGAYSKTGHLSVGLGRKTNGKPVHQLVAKTFIGECPDNRLENLRYGTRTENILDVYYQGNKWRKLSIDDVYFVRFALLCGFAGKWIASVSKIKVGGAFKWLA